MNQLSKRNDGYPFRFFLEKEIPKDEVIKAVIDGYMEVGERESDPVISRGRLASRLSMLYSYGAAARICLMDENFDTVLTPGYSDELRDLYERMDGDLERAYDIHHNLENEEHGFSFLPSGAGFTKESKPFHADIAIALEHEKMFYLNLDYNHQDLLMFELSDNDGVFHPFSKGNVEKLFRNIPIKRVW